MREIIQGNSFKRDYKKIAASGRYSVKDFLLVVELLAHDKPLPEKHHDHPLKGEWIGYRECHIKPDWLLIYLSITIQIFLPPLNLMLLMVGIKHGAT